jgi:hypothetical protein
VRAPVRVGEQLCSPRVLVAVVRRERAERARRLGRERKTTQRGFAHRAKGVGDGRARGGAERDDLAARQHQLGAAR